MLCSLSNCCCGSDRPTRKSANGRAKANAATESSNPMTSDATGYVGRRRGSRRGSHYGGDTEQSGEPLICKDKVSLEIPVPRPNPSGDFQSICKTSFVFPHHVAGPLLQKVTGF